MKYQQNTAPSLFNSISKLAKNYWWAWIMLAAAACFGLAMWLGMQQSVWFDEAYSITLAKQSYGDMIHSTAIDVHPPLYYIVLKAWSQVFGMGEFALRSLSALLAAAAAGVGLVFVRRVFGVRAVIAATPLLLLSPLLVRYGFELRMYALGSLLTITATYVLVRATQTTNHKLHWWIGYAVLVALGMYTLYYMAFVWIAHIVWLLYRHFSAKPRAPFFKQPWILAFAGAFALYLPWLPSFIEQQRDPALSGIAQRVSWEQMTDVFSFLFTYQPHWTLNGWGYGLIVALVAGTGYTIARAIRRAGPLRPYLVLLLCIFIVPLILMTIGSIPPLRPLFLIRYISHFAIVFPLLIGASLVIAFRNKLRYAVTGAAVLAGVLLYGMCNLQQRGNYVFDMLTRPHARQAVQAIGQCEDGSIVMAGSPLIYFELDYYMPDCNIYFYSTHPIGDKGGYATIYKSPKQYYDQDPLNATTVYLVYAGQHPELPGNFVKMSSQSFEKYQLDIYRAESQ